MWVWLFHVSEYLSCILYYTFLILCRYQPLLIYLAVAITCFWLIILPLVDDKKFLSNDLIDSTNSLTTECNLSKLETDTDGRKLLSTVATILPSPTAVLLEPHFATHSYSAQSTGIAIAGMSLYETVFSMAPSNGPVDFTQHAMASSTPAEVVSSSHSVTSFLVPTPSVKVPRRKHPAENAPRANTTAISANETNISTYTTASSTYTTTTNDITTIPKNKTVTSAKHKGSVNCETDTSDAELVWQLTCIQIACSTVYFCYTLTSEITQVAHARFAYCNHLDTCAVT